MLITFSLLLIVSNSVTVNTHGSGEYSIKPLHVAGNKILTSDGDVVILRGVDYSYFIDGPYGSWMLPDGEIEWNTWDTTAINSNLDAIQSWGCNAVRIPTTIQWWTQNTNNFQSNLQYFISQAASRSIYVDFVLWRDDAGEGQQPPLPYPPYDNSSIIKSVRDFVNVWSSIATSLKGYPNVMFELWNEPNGDATAEASWLNATQQCIDSIRESGARNLIIVQWGSNIYVDFQNYRGTPDSYGSLDWVSTNQLNDPAKNIVYSTHLYGNSFFDSMNNYVPKYSYSDMLWALNFTGLLSIASQHPVLIGEIGCNLWAGSTDNEYAWYNNTLTILNQYAIGYCGWAWAPWKTWHSMGSCKRAGKLCTKSRGTNTTTADRYMQTVLKTGSEREWCLKPLKF